MKKRIVSMLTVIAMVTAFLPVISVPAMAADEWDGTADTSWYNESGTSFDISTPAELAGLASLVNDGTTFKNKTIRLTEDLDLGGKEWTPIGGETNQKAFQGTFEGYDHIISKLNISSSDFTYIGLFGVVSGSVKNLTVMPVSVTVPAGSTYYGGIIAGYVKGGKLFDCHTVEGTIFGGANSKLGGIAGYSATGGSITLCSDDDTAVTHTTQGTGGYAGGIVGYNNSGCNVTGCYNKGNITGGYLAGGIVGQNGGTVSHCYNTGNVKSLSGIVPAAGICGTTSSGATTEYCHNYGSGSGDYLGIGTTQKTGSSPYGTISNCYYLNGKNHSKDTNSKQLTADQFKSLDNFEGWAATGCWGMDSVNFPYPVLNNTVFLYDYKISLYVYNAQDGNYMLAQTIYKDAGEYLTSNDLGDPTSGYTVWTTDKNDFTDASKYKIIDENGFSVTESTNLYAVNVAPQGEGTEAAPYLIPNAPTLEYVRDKINADNEWANKYYALTADIDLNGSEDNQWTPIGNISLNFRGSFDGRGHTVKGLYINNNTADYQGLFGYSTGQIKNLMVEGKVTGNNDVGGIAGYAGWNSTITACANKAAVRGKDVVGGIAGGASQVRRSYNTGSVTVTGTDSYVGAICGYISPSSYTLDSFYLEGTAEKGYGNLSPDVYGDFGLSEELFNSGYVAYRLNGYLVDSDPPAQDIWGQKIGTDDFPVLLTDDNREDCTVYSASFYRKFDADKWSYDAESLSEDPSMTPPEIVWIDDTFANKGSKFSLTPLLQSEAQKEEFNAADAWVLDMADIKNADKYITNADDEALICTGKDITLYAVEDINNTETESDGSAEHPYQIPDAATLAKFRDKINAADEAFISAHYELTDNIDLKNENWTPIGTDDNKFNGTFDGKGYTISGFKIEKSGPLMGDDSMIGFFKIIGENGVVKNLTLEGEMTINSGDAFAVGAIAGLNEGKITGCHSAVNITSTGYFVGGIAGQFSSGYSSLSNAITNCYNTGSITARTDYACAGGIVGHVGSSNLGVGYCYNTGSVSATGAGASADGIIGANYGVTARNYYLEDTVSSDYGTEKTSAQFASGEVTWLMQSVQSAQAWGQNLSGNGDDYPILTSEADKKVYRIEFKKKDGEDYTSAAADAYVNSAGIAELPSFKTGSHTFSHWALDTATKEEYEAGTAVTSDIVLYATHEWEYTVSGTTITATCKNTDGACTDTNGGSVTLTAPTENLVYNTESHDAVVTNTITAKTGDTVTVKYEYKAAADGSYAETNTTVNAGFYKASITLDTDKTISVEYAVAKATPEYTEPTTPQSATYGDTLGGLTLPAGFVWDKGDNESVGNVGNNSFTATLTPNDRVNYNTVQKTITVNVSALPETIINADDVTTDFINETIGNFANGTYIITVDDNSTEIAVTDGTIPIDNSYLGKDIAIVKKARNSNYTDSHSITLSIPARPSKPSGVEVTKATDDNAANGKITGVDDTLEYKAADDETWTQIDGNEITELLPGTYYVRVAPTDNAFASEVAPAVIGVMDKVTVVFIDGDGNTLDTQIVAPYTKVTYKGNTPTKTATAQFTYEFTDWDKEVGEVTEDTTFTAQFDEHLRSYKIKWIVDTTETETDADYGTIPSYGESNPTKTADEYYTYVFDKWTPDIVSVAGAASYTALFNNIPQSYTVTLNTNGGTVTGEFASYSYGTALALPTAEQITKDNCVFGGWYDNKNLDGEVVTAITADATGSKTYFAKWTTIEPPQSEAYSIKGTVYDAEGIAAQSVTVTLKKGIEEIGSDTITDGSFIFDEVSDGIYNIIAETGAKSATATVTVSGKSVDNVVITLPQTNISAKVDIIGEDTPAIVVSGLDEVAADEAKEETADVKLTMTVQSEEADSENEQQKAINEVKANSNVEYLDISLIKTTITSGSIIKEEKLSTSDSTVAIVIPYDTTRLNIKVYRYDAAATAKAVTLSAADTESEYYKISDGYITIHTGNFATYAIGYDAPAATDTPRRSGGGSSRAKATPTPSPSATPEPAETAVPESTATPKPTEEPSDWWYTDVPENEWYYEPVKAVTNKGLMTGVWNGENADEFQPDFEISRAMFVTVLYRIEGEPETSLNYTFEDILKGWYYEKAVAWGSANGIIAGYDKKTFAPDDNITREQMAAMLWRYAKYKGIDVSVGDDTNILSFNDAENITEYAIPAIQWAYGEDIINGYTDNTLRPQANTTRAQAAVVFGKIDDIVK